MTVIYHNRGVGGGRGPVQYLLGKDYDRENAELLRGDPDETIDLIDSLEFKKRYTSGLLSFEETDLTDEQKNEIMDEFERATFTGMDKDQYSIMWVEHSDKNNTELNFVIPNVELNSGKRLQPYYDKVDRQRINQFRDITNIKYDLSNPLSREHEQSLSINKDLPFDKKEYVKKLDKHFLEGIEKGTIGNREDIKKQLEMAGVKIARETDKSLSIENPAGGQNIRLKGAIYERSFGCSAEARRERQEAIKEFREKQSRSLESTEKEYRESLERKSQYHEKIYRQVEPKDLVKDDRLITRGIDSGLSDLKHSIRNNSIAAEKTINSNREIEPGKSRTREPRSVGRGDSTGGRSAIHSPSKNNNNRHTGNISDRGQRSPQTNKEITNDRNGKSINERLREFRERARNTATNARERLTDFAKGIRSTSDRVGAFIKGEQANNRLSKNLGRQVNNLDKAIAKEQEMSRSRSRSIMRDTGWGR